MSVPTITTSSNSPITKELLEELTGRQVIHYLVENGSKPGDGYMSVLYSVDLILQAKERNQGAVKETRHFLFKCFPLHPARQSYLSRMNMFYNELAFYQFWVKALRDFQMDVVGLPEKDLLVPAFPPFVSGKAIDFSKLDEIETNSTYSPLDNFIVMKNLKKEGFRMTEKAAGLDFDHLSLVFTELAKAHALSWAYKNTVEMDVLKKFPFLNIRFPKQELEYWINIVQSRVETAVKTLDIALGGGNNLSKATKKYGENVSQVVDFFIEQNENAEIEAWKVHRSPPQNMVDASKNEETWLVQLHGDSWSNNFLFKYNEASKPERAILFDFQLTRQGCPTVDLSYLIYTSTTSKFRKAHLDTLLQLYCDKFTEFCDHLKVPVLPGFTLTSLKGRFHRAKITGYMMALVAFPLIYMEPSNEVNMEQSRDDTSMEEMMVAECEKRAVESTSYKERVLDAAQGVYDDGVI